MATAYNDSAAYGDLYQWGRGTDGHEKRNSSTTTTLSSSDTPGHGRFIITPGGTFSWRKPVTYNQWQGPNGVNNPCPSGSRLPTITEWEAERVTWATNDGAGAFASPLKLVSAGWRNRDGEVTGTGIEGDYYSSSVTDGGWWGALSLYFDSGRATTTQSGYFGIGMTVRCIED